MEISGAALSVQFIPLSLKEQRKHMEENNLPANIANYTQDNSLKPTACCEGTALTTVHNWKSINEYTGLQRACEK